VGGQPYAHTPGLVEKHELASPAPECADCAKGGEKPAFLVHDSGRAGHARRARRLQPDRAFAELECAEIAVAGRLAGDALGAVERECGFDPLEDALLVDLLGEPGRSDQRRGGDLGLWFCGG